MSDDDLIRRGDARDILSEEGWLGRSLERIKALPAVTVGVKDFDVEVVRGNTGGNLALYFNDHRVAGSKPWGGGTIIHKFRVQGDEAKSAGILATTRDFRTVPPVKECLTTDTALPAVTVGVLTEAQFMDAVWAALKADATDLGKQQRILAAFRAALEPVTQPDPADEYPYDAVEQCERDLDGIDPAAIREAALREAAEMLSREGFEYAPKAVLALLEKPHERA